MTNTQKTIKYIAFAFAIALTFLIVSIIFEVGLSIISGITGLGKDKVTASYGYKNIRELNVDMGVGDLIIKCEGDKFLVNANELVDFKNTEEDGVLTIDVDGAGFSFIPTGEDSYLEIIIPEGTTLDLLNIEMGVGECNMSDVAAKDVTFETGIGEFNCEKFTVNNLSMDTGIGEVFLSLTGKESDYSFSLDKGIGEAEINDDDYNTTDYDNSNAPYSIEIDCGIGDISIETN